MDLRSELLELIAPIGIGDSLGESRLIDVSAELGLRLVFEHRGRDVVVEVDPISENRRSAARSRHFSFGYRLGDRGAPIESSVGLALCARIASAVTANEDAVTTRLSGIAPSEGRIREIRGERLLERAGTPDERYWTLSPYTGCLIGCRFCYAPSRLDPLRRLARLPELPWGSWVDARVDAPEVLARELRALEPWPIKLCPIVSDPYHAIEAKLRVTRRCLEVIRDAPPRDVLVLTRSAAIVEDAELLASIPRASAGVSLPTVDDDVRRHFEPRGASVSERLAALDALKRSGVRTFAIVQPIFPGPLVALADALAERVASVRIDVLYGTYAGDFTPYPGVTDPGWQRAAADELGRLLIARGVRLWTGELAPV
jgi:DNA repair photolyase